MSNVVLSEGSAPTIILSTTIAAIVMAAMPVANEPFAKLLLSIFLAALGALDISGPAFWASLFFLNKFMTNPP